MPMAARMAMECPIKQDRGAAALIAMALIAMATQVAMHTAASVAALVCNPPTVSQMIKPPRSAECLKSSNICVTGQKTGANLIHAEPS